MDSLLVLLLFGFMGPFAVIYILAKPKTYILVFIALSPLINLLWAVRVFGFSTIDFLMGAFTATSVVIFVRLSGRGEWSWGRYTRYYVMVLAGFLIAVISAVFTGADFRSSFELFAKVLCGFISYCIFINLFEEEDQTRLVNAILTAVSITIVMVLAQLVTGRGVGYAAHTYVQGMYHDPGQYTRMALYGIIIVLPLMKVRTGRLGFYAKAAILMLSVVTLALSISRNVVFAAVAVVAIYSIMWRRLHLALAVALVGVAVYIYMPGVQQTYEHKLSKEISYLRGEHTYVESLGSGRVGMWKRSLHDFEEAGMYRKLFGTGSGFGSHGEYIGLLQAVGIYGLLAMIILYLRLLKDSYAAVRKDRENLPAVYSMLMVIVVFIMAIGSAPFTNFYFQILLFGFVAIMERSAVNPVAVADGMKDAESLPGGVSGEIRALPAAGETVEPSPAAAEPVEVGVTRYEGVGPLMGVRVGTTKEGWQIRGLQWAPPLAAALKWIGMAAAPGLLLLAFWLYSEKTSIIAFPPIAAEQAVMAEVPALRSAPEEAPGPLSVWEIERRARQAEKAKEEISAPPPPVLESVKPPVMTAADGVEKMLATARGHFGRKAFGRAEKVCEEIIDLEPRERRAYFLLGDIYLERGEYERAKRMYGMAASMAGANGG